MQAQTNAVPRPTVEVLRDYLALTKPRIVLLLLVTTWAAMLVAGGHAPPAGLALLTMLGGALSAGSANAFNMYIERDRDRLMERTQDRPLPAGRLAANHALIFASVLGIASFIVLAVGVNLLAAVLATVGLLSYVLVYTWWLKPRSVHNTLAGGVAGAMPPLVGWAAVTGTVDWSAFLLFCVIFFWELPHTWALATLRHDDYARAGIMMMPVVAGLESTRRQSFVYTLLMIASSLGLYFTGALGVVYLIAAILLAIGFLQALLVYMREDGMEPSRKLFRFSLLYLAGLFALMVIDTVLPW